jgi:Stigma-specific protein, Stig1
MHAMRIAQWTLLTAVPCSAMLLLACPDGAPAGADTGSSDATSESITGPGPLTLDESSTGAEACPTGQERCDVACVDIDADPLHCGACFIGCESHQSCVDGECSPACSDGGTECDGVCVDTQSLPTHCGGCGSVCDDLEDCERGECVFAGCEFGRPCGDCPAGLADCDPDVDGCEADLAAAATCGACDHSCDDGDTCQPPDCVHVQELVGNGDFSAGIAGWTIDNNPIDSGDAFANFVVSGGELTVFPAEGPHAKVVFQDVMVPPDPLGGAVFSVCFYQDMGGQDPENVVEIQVDPFDEDGDGLPQNALRIDLVDPGQDVFVAPAIVTLFAPTTPIGSPAMCVTSTFEDPPLTAELSAHAGQLLRLRVAHVESTFPWDLEIDDVSLAVEQIY